jgi:hypothetical protein
MLERRSAPRQPSRQSHLMLSRGRVIFSRALNRRSENVIVEAIIIPELELRNVEWHVFAATLATSFVNLIASPTHC